MLTLDENVASLITLILSGIALLVSLWQTIYERHTEIAISRYLSVVSPLFELAEPYMIRSDHCSSLDASAIRSILKEHPQYCGGKLRRYRFSNLCSQSESTAFCRLISREYDRSCRKLGIPLRTQTYRISTYYPRFCILDLIVFTAKYTFFAVFFLGLILRLGLLLVESASQGNPISIVGLVALYAVVFSTVKLQK